MTVKDLVRELQGLVNTGHGDEQLMVDKEKLKADVFVAALDNAAVIWLHAGPFAQLAIRGLPQPQEQVKPKGRPFAFTEQNRNRLERVTGHGQYCACAMCFA